MRTDTSFVVVSHEPAMPPGMRRFSKATKVVLAALALMLVSFGTSAVAGDGPYVGIGGSLSILNDSAVTAPEREPFISTQRQRDHQERVCRERHGRLRLSQRLPRGGRDRLPQAQYRQNGRQEPRHSCINRCCAAIRH